MPYPDLQSFLRDLEQRGQLRRVRVPVDPELEITEIADRVSKSPSPEGAAGAPRTDPLHGGRGGVGLLFEQVRGSAFPLVINAYGSYARVKLALGCNTLEELADRVQRLAKPEPPTTLMEKMKALPELMKLASFPPKVVKRGMCQEVVKTDDANLFDLPAIKCWPFDGGADEEVIVQFEHEGTTKGTGNSEQESERCDEATKRRSDEGTVTPCSHPVGRYITFAGIYTKSYDGRERNVGMYRIQLLGPKEAAFHCHVHHDGARHQRQWAARGEPMPMAVVLGGESVLPYAATCPLPPGVSELLFAGFLNGGAIELTPAKTIPLEVPANAEFVIEGWVDPRMTVREGPFGDHTGFYSLAARYPLFRITAITHRRNPVFPATIVGKPPMEDYYLGKATERVFLPLLQMLIPDVIDYHLPMFGAFHNCAFVRIRKEYPYQARRVMSSIWGAGQMSFTKFIIVVDEDVNVHDEQAVLFAMGANVDPRRDTMIVDGPMDILDHATPYLAAGSKIGIDATRKIPGEGVVRDWPTELTMCGEVRELVTRRWREYGL
ncbi:MAG: UbiD family decarboxylase [Phycisphaerae bacterium]|nr:UbiD family decarboxylase [Phycisphaerae bacterium]NUQ45895.1 UbiD family decarboxylase [Phycisphaerae bacterium]